MDQKIKRFHHNSKDNSGNNIEKRKPAFVCFFVLLFYEYTEHRS